LPSSWSDKPFERVRDGWLLPWRGEVQGKVKKKGYKKVAYNKLVTTSYHVTNCFCTSSFRTVSSILKRIHYGSPFITWWLIVILQIIARWNFFSSVAMQPQSCALLPIMAEPLVNNVIQIFSRWVSVIWFEIHKGTSYNLCSTDNVKNGLILVDAGIPITDSCLLSSFTFLNKIDFRFLNTWAPHN
jgi:hypothetical protein